MTLPKTPIKGDPETRRFLEAVRQSLDGVSRNALTLDDLRRRGFWESNGIELPTQDETFDSPTTPTSLLASGSFQNIILTWDYAPYRGHSHSRLYRNTVNVFSSASLLANIEAKVYADPVGSNKTFYYWVTNVNLNGIEGPPSQTTGVMGQTAQDVQFLLTTLTGAITESQLYSTLGARIDLIDAAAGTAGSVNARLQQEATTRAQAVLDEAAARANGDANLQTQINTITAATTGDLQDVLAAVSAEQTARTNADAAEAAARETLATQIRGAYTGTDVSLLTTGLLYNERVARVDADSAEASARSALSATVTNNYSTLNAAISAEQTARADADSALTLSVSSLTATVNSNTAAINFEATTRADADTALSNQINSLTATVNANTAAITTEQTARVDADSALSTQITTLQASTGSNTTAIQNEITARTNADNTLFAQYTVKIDTNGYVSGFGLASTSTGAAPTSSFIVRSDSFSIASPSGPGISPSMPFIVRTTPTTINGVSVPAGVYMSDAFIQNGSISNAKIGNAVIDDAKIANLSAQKITTGQLDAARVSIDGVTLDSYYDSSVGRNRLRIRDLAVDTAKIADLAVGNGKIANLAVNALKIAGNAVTQPVNFTASDVAVTSQISFSYQSVGAGNGDYEYYFDPYTYYGYYVQVGMGYGSYILALSGGHVAAETANIVVGDAVGGSLMVVVYATADTTQALDAGQEIYLMADTGSGYTIVGNQKLGVVTSNGNTYSIIPFAIAKTLTNIQTVRLKVVVGKYKIAAAGTLNNSYLRNITISAIGAAR